MPAPDGISQVLAEQSKWNKFTPIIEDLYLRENLPDHVVGYIMRTLYNFSARCVYLSLPLYSLNRMRYSLGGSRRAVPTCLTSFGFYYSDLKLDSS